MQEWQPLLTSNITRPLLTHSTVGNKESIQYLNFDYFPENEKRYGVISHSKLLILGLFKGTNSAVVS
jgi:hypothetical protein